VVSRFSVTAEANIADTNSEQIILVIPKPDIFHNGGQIAFGPDGYLYVGVGDGGAQNDSGQSTSTLLGKLLRIDVEGGTIPYAVPTNNPFVGNTNYAPEIWALGLRNPWRFSFDRLTGDLYIGDVGANRFEEVDFQPNGSPGGQNYGWRIVEGPTNYSVPSGFTNFSMLTPPVAWYDHLSLPTDVAGAVIGGYVYRGPSEPRMEGMYFFGDFMSGWVWGLKQTGTNWQKIAILHPGFTFHFAISTFGQDEQGNLYLADYSAGQIHKIQDLHQAWTPTFTPTNGVLYSNIVVVSCITTNVVIHYTTNGVDPTLSDPIVAQGGAIIVQTGFTNKARAFRADLNPSDVGRAIYTNKVAPITFSPRPGAVTNGTLITIGTLTPGVTIYYTTNLLTPTTNSTVYSSPQPVNRNLVFKAFGAETGYSNTDVVFGQYSLVQVAQPVFTPASGPIANGTTVSISCSTTGAAIYFTTDGSSPTTNSARYTNPITLQGDTKLSALALKPGYINSVVTSVFFDRVKAMSPSYYPSQGPLAAGTVIEISNASPNSVIRYTLDGTAPSTNSPIYLSPLTFTNAITLSAVTFQSGLNPSDALSVFFGLIDFEHTVVTTVA
jgi:hypothetical protein